MYQSCSEIDAIETVAAVSPFAPVSMRMSRRVPDAAMDVVFEFMSFVAVFFRDPGNSVCRRGA
jgi:hypothetical protein